MIGRILTGGFLPEISMASLLLVCELDPLTTVNCCSSRVLEIVGYITVGSYTFPSALYSITNFTATDHVIFKSVV